MKKKFLIFIIVILLFAFTACDLGQYSDSPAISGGGAQSRPNEEEALDGEHYTAALFFKNEPFYVPDAGIEVVWRNSRETVKATLKKDGTADAGVLDGDYGVYLNNLPKEYCYNPNICKAPDNEGNRHVSIFIYELQTPPGDGDSFLISEGCYETRKEGMYRVQLEKGQKKYFSYTPTSEGKYSVKSLASVYENNVNPFIEIGTSNAGNFWMPLEIVDGSTDVKGGYTKNFEYIIDVDSEYIGSSFFFAVMADSRTGIYPVTLDIEIKYESLPTVTAYDLKVMRAQEITNLALPPVGTFVSAADAPDARGHRKFDGSKYVYDGNVGLYRVFDAAKYPETGGLGPYLCCNITKKSECYKLTSLYDANFVGETGQNFLELIDDREKIKYDYEQFIRNDYFGVCNADGRCYVTKELKEFLQRYAENRELWTDGVSKTNDIPEGLNYDAAQDDMWLFACGYYVDDGE